VLIDVIEVLVNTMHSGRSPLVFERILKQIMLMGTSIFEILKMGDRRKYIALPKPR